MKRTFRTVLCLALAAMLFCCSAFLRVPGSAALAEAAPELQPEHAECTLAMMEYLEGNPELKALMEKSIRKSHEVNPDPNTNPVNSVDELYDFLDWAVTCMPWNVLTGVSYPTLYNSIDQSID